MVSTHLMPSTAAMARSIALVILAVSYVTHSSRVSS